MKKNKKQKKTVIKKQIHPENSPSPESKKERGWHRGPVGVTAFRRSGGVPEGFPAAVPGMTFPRSMQTSDEFTEPRGPQDNEPHPRSKAVAAVRAVGHSPALIFIPHNSPRCQIS